MSDYLEKETEALIVHLTTKKDSAMQRIETAVRKEEDPLDALVEYEELKTDIEHLQAALGIYRHWHTPAVVR